MSEIVVRARKLCKAYTLYPSQWDRMREILGRKRPAGVEYPTHVAVDNIDLDIRAGEKVAFVGRNGAGKSTLLKLITGVIEPTSGSLDIVGETHALLQMGSGFHQEFTGRQNIKGYLANLGVSGSEADQFVSDIVAFSELEEYIDQPLKVYSTGMAMRLIFAASTAIAPKMFVVDEVLGVGDAYFQNKSFARLQELVEKNATTLLLVSHDIYTAAKICDRMVWIDHGRIKYDGDPKTALNLYESSIREQEEQRLIRRQLSSKANTKQQEQDSAILSLRPIENETIDVASTQLAFGRFFISWPGGKIEGQPISSDKGENWGSPKEIDGRMARPFLTYGSIFRKLGLLIEGEGLGASLVSGKAELVLEGYATTPVSIDVSVSHPHSRREYGGQLVFDGSGWQTIKASLPERPVTAAAEIHARYGTRHLEIVDVSFHDQDGRQTQRLRPLQDLKIRLRYRVNDPDFKERPVILVAFQKDGSVRTNRFWTSQFELSGASQKNQGVLEIEVRPLQLGAGTYFVTVSAFREGYFEGRSDGRFFSINDKVLDMRARAFEIEIAPDPSNPLVNDVIFHQPAEWRLVEDIPLHTESQ